MKKIINQTIMKITPSGCFLLGSGMREKIGVKAREFVQLILLNDGTVDVRPAPGDGARVVDLSKNQFSQAIKKVDVTGRVHLPLEMRERMGMEPGDAVALILLGNGALNLRPLNRLGAYREKIAADLRVLGEMIGRDVLVCDRCDVVAAYTVSGEYEYVGMEISAHLAGLIVRQESVAPGFGQTVSPLEALDMPASLVRSFKCRNEQGALVVLDLPKDAIPLSRESFAILEFVARKLEKCW